MLSDNFPNLPGTYALLLKVEEERYVQVGARGKIKLHPGYYIYLGSAFSKGGLRGRLRHHLRPVTKPHWHIDYLHPFCQLVDIWYTLNPLQSEHTWAAAASQLLEASIPLLRFGASDCQCKTHLFYFPTQPGWEVFCRVTLMNGVL